MANASDIITDDMTLEQKLSAIEEAMKVAQSQNDEKAAKNGEASAPVDPQDFLMCEGCQ